MCTNPIQRTITYRGNFSKKTIEVPCGKCAECRAKKQSEFAALSVLEAESAGSIGFITLTYDNASLPVVISILTPGDEVQQRAFSRGLKLGRSEVCKPFFNGCFEEDRTVLEEFVCASLRREDVQKFIKRYRQDYFRRKGERLDFRFSFFGEYGERFKRPHYHMLVYGLEKSECQRLCSLWCYGFSDLKFVEHFNSDGSDAFSKVSRYVSKYISKGDFLPDFVRAGYAEKPRRQSSIHFGQRDLNLDSLRNFT